MSLRSFAANRLRTLKQQSDQDLALDPNRPAPVQPHAYSRSVNGCLRCVPSRTTAATTNSPTTTIPTGTGFGIGQIVAGGGSGTSARSARAAAPVPASPRPWPSLSDGWPQRSAS